MHEPPAAAPRARTTWAVLLSTLWLAGLVVIVPSRAFAAKTDVVVLQNGDRLTGEVRQLRRDQLKLDTDDAGTIYIEWDKIAAVTTAGRYEVATGDGARYVGTLAPAAGQLAVVAENGTITRLPFSDVVSIASIKSGFFDRIDGSVDLGGSYTKSSRVGQATIDLEAAYRRPAYEGFIDVSSTLTRQRDSSSVTSRWDVKSGYRRFRGERWFVTPLVLVERNTDLGLSLRTLGALTVGRYLQRSNRSTTLAAAGVAAGRERLIDGGTVGNVDALVSVATSFYTYDYPRSSLDLTVMVLPELNRLGRVRANVDAKAKRELFKDFFVALTAYDTFDSQPQVAGVSKDDVGLTFSIGWTF